MLESLESFIVMYLFPANYWQMQPLFSGFSMPLPQDRYQQTWLRALRIGLSRGYLVFLYIKRVLYVQWYQKEAIYNWQNYKFTSFHKIGAQIQWTADQPENEEEDRQLYWSDNGSNGSAPFTVNLNPASVRQVVLNCCAGPLVSFFEQK